MGWDYWNVFKLLQTLDQRTKLMAIDVSKLTASETRLVADVELLLASAAATKAALADVSAQLAAAIAANDPVAMAAAQKAIDDVVVAMDAESAKVDPVVSPPAP